MKELKKYAKYIIWIIAGYFLTNFLIFVGFNASYKSIELRGNLPQQISIEKAEANKVQGRIYGYVQNTSENDLNGKYIKITAYNSVGENIKTEYLKIDNLESDNKKLFRSAFTADDVKSYEIDVVENE